MGYSSKVLRAAFGNWTSTRVCGEISKKDCLFLTSCGVPDFLSFAQTDSDGDVSNLQRERETHTHRHTHRARNTHKDTHRNKDTPRWRCTWNADTCTDGDRHTHKNTHTQVDRHTQAHMDTQTHIKENGWGDLKTQRGHTVQPTQASQGR